MRISAGVITIPNRGQMLCGTLQSLLESGLHCCRIYTDLERSGCWQAWLRLLNALLRDAGREKENRQPDWLLLAEDDVFFARGLGDYLQHNPPPAGSIANLFCSPECHSPELMQWHRQPCPARFHGSLALLIDIRTARRILENTPFLRRRDGTDHNLGTFAREHGIPYVVHSPSLVLHATTETSLTEAGGREENRQAFCFVEAIDVLKTAELVPPLVQEIPGVGHLPAGHRGALLADADPSRCRLPQYPHTIAVQIGVSGAQNPRS